MMNFKIGDWVKIKCDLKDAYEETWHEKGDVLQVERIAKDGEGLMFWSDLGVHYSMAEEAMVEEWII
jgi:hypothetical protein